MVERRPKILIVDDEPFIVHAVSLALRGEGFEVAACSEWTEVARAMRMESPDIVLLDYHMPGLKGDSICAILKRNPAQAGVGILLFSSEAPAELERIAEACGADGFIPKNARGDEMLGRLRQVLDERRSAG